MEEVPSPPNSVLLVPTGGAWDWLGPQELDDFKEGILFHWLSLIPMLEVCCSPKEALVLDDGAGNIIGLLMLKLNLA